MPITNLSGYTWVANNTITFAESGKPNYSIYFYDAGNNSYSNFYILNPQKEIDYNNDVVYRGRYIDSQGWLNPNYKTITFTHDSLGDTQREALVTFLEANGTLTAPSPSGINNTSIGDKKIVKKHIGNREVVKEVVNKVVVYEKAS